MGGPMAGHLLAAGYEVTIWNRTRARAEQLEAAGARWVDSPGEVSAASDVVLTMHGYPHDVRDVVLGADGVRDSADAGSVLIELTHRDPTRDEGHDYAANGQCVIRYGGGSRGQGGERTGRDR